MPTVAPTINVTELPESPRSHLFNYTDTAQNTYKVFVAGKADLSTCDSAFLKKHIWTELDCSDHDINTFKSKTNLLIVFVSDSNGRLIGDGSATEKPTFQIIAADDLGTPSCTPTHDDFLLIHASLHHALAPSRGKKQDCIQNHFYLVPPLPAVPSQPTARSPLKSAAICLPTSDSPAGPASPEILCSICKTSFSHVKPAQQSK